jgi:hypothetical protein
MEGSARGAPFCKKILFFFSVRREAEKDRKIEIGEESRDSVAV